MDLGWQFSEYFSTKLYTFTEWMKRKGTPFFKNVELDAIELELRYSVDYDDWIVIDANEILPLMDSVEDYLNTLLLLIDK